MTDNSTKTVAIIGAGAAGLMAAEVLSARGVPVQLYDKMPTAGRKILMAGKTGLNISHSEPLNVFVSRYQPPQVLDKWVRDFSADDIRSWLDGLGIDSYVGSSGRIFPVQMKASKFLRAWLTRLSEQGVAFFYRHDCVDIINNQATFVHTQKDGTAHQFSQSFAAIILACGGGSYARLGSDGSWQAWFTDDELMPLYASNAGVVRSWSQFMQPIFGQAVKRVTASVGDESAHGDIVISHYGMESGLIYRLNHAMRQSSHDGKITLNLDLLPNKSQADILKILNSNKKQSLSNALRKARLDPVKIALLRECTDKTDWSDLSKMATLIKNLSITFDGFRPIDEAISTGGGVKFSAVNDDLQLRRNPYVFVAGEMLAWDAPTGGYLLTACLAMGRAVGENVAKFVQKSQN